jgi:hypothetical protein
MVIGGLNILSMVISGDQRPWWYLSHSTSRKLP